MIRRAGMRLQTRLLLVVAFVELFAIGMGLAYWVQAHAQARLEAAFRQDLAVLSKLPQLGDSLRRLDDLTDAYLLDGGPGLLARRQEALRSVRRAVQGLADIMDSPEDAARVRELQRVITAYQAEQEQWLARRSAGRVSRADAARYASLSTPFDRIAASLTAVKDVSPGELRRRRDAVRRAAGLALLAVLGLGLAASLALGAFVSRTMIQPVLRLEAFARGWHLGQPWSLEDSPAGPEVATLRACMKEMAQRLNAQFGRERELARMKTQLVSMVSHEFNNAMAVITGVTALLEESEGEPAGRRSRYYGMIKDSIKTLALTSSNLMNMGRLEGGRFAVSPRRTDVAALLRETGERLEILSARKQQAVSLELPEEAVAVKADPEALSLVVTNLFSNAIKYTPQGGSIVLGLRRQGGEVEVFCRDSGIGISEEDRRRIVKGYYRTESGKRAAKGFGIGLALANSIVDAHGSKLLIDSEPGKGSTFRFALPPWPEGKGAQAPATTAP